MTSFVPGMLVGGKFRLIKQLGEGAMGVVWSAAHHKTMGQFALKLIWKPEPEYKVRLYREARACATINHKNVVKMYDVEQTEDGDPFLVMQLLSGETLADLLARKRRLPPAEAAGIGRDIARGLSAAHAADIIHRDLKPANIFLHNEPGEAAPVVKVLDFGVAKNLSFDDGLRTATGGAVGSPVYMSPEQARKERDIDARADIWSLGVVLFEMIAGERPFKGGLAEVLHQIEHANIPKVSHKIRHTDPQLDAIIAGCLARRREDRLGPALEVARMLDEVAGPGGRQQLPSLLEEAMSERNSVGVGSISEGVDFSPGIGPAGSPAATSPGFGASQSPGGASAGWGGLALERASGPGRSPSGGYPTAPRSVTEPLSPPALDDNAMTHRLDPRMLAPRAAAPVQMPQPGPDSMGPSGTVRIDPKDIEQRIAGRHNVTQPLAVPPAPPPAAPAPPPVDGAATSNAPVFRPGVVEEAAPRKGAARKAILFGGIAVGVIGLAAMIYVFASGPSGAPTNAVPEGVNTGSVAPPPSQGQTAAPPLSTEPPNVAPPGIATASPTSVPSNTAPPATPTAEVKPPPSTPPTASAKPTATVKGPMPKAPACTSKFPGRCPKK